MNALHLSWVEFWELNMLFGSLVELLPCCIYLLVFFHLENLIFLQTRQLLNTFRQLGCLSSFSASFYCIIDSFWIHRETFCLLDRCLIAVRSIDVGFCLIAAQQLLDLSRSSCMHYFFSCFASFYYLVIHNILFHYIHPFMDSLYPLDHLYVSRVKLYSFLYPLSIMTKRGINCKENVVSF